MSDLLDLKEEGPQIEVLALRETAHLQQRAELSHHFARASGLMLGIQLLDRFSPPSVTFVDKYNYHSLCSELLMSHLS